MREADWQFKDKADIITLIVKHNAGIEVTPEQERRIRGKLENMTAVELWAHIDSVYGGVLLEPDLHVLSDREQLERQTALLRWKPPVHKTVKAIPDYKVPLKYNAIDEAETIIYGWRNVKGTYRNGPNDLYVLVLSDKDKIERKIKRLYPTINATVAIYAGI